MRRASDMLRAYTELPVLLGAQVDVESASPEARARCFHQ